MSAPGLPKRERRARRGRRIRARAHQDGLAPRGGRLFLERPVAASPEGRPAIPGSRPSATHTSRPWQNRLPERKQRSSSIALRRGPMDEAHTLERVLSCCRDRRGECRAVRHLRAPVGINCEDGSSSPARCGKNATLSMLQKTFSVPIQAGLRLFWWIRLGFGVVGYVIALSTQ
jgi:hypothetical protein